MISQVQKKKKKKSILGLGAASGIPIETPASVIEAKSVDRLTRGIHAPLDDLFFKLSC